MSGKNMARRAAVALLVAAVYVLAGKIGLALAFVNASATAVWPPTGIALAAVILAGNRVWPAIFLGAFFTNELTAGTTITSLLIAAGNTLEAIVGAALFTRLVPIDSMLTRGRDVAALVLAVLAAALVSATVGVTTIASAGLAPWSDFAPVWLTWWLGDATGGIVIAPAILLWTTTRRHWSRRDLGDLLAAAVLVAALGWFVFVVTPQPIAFVCIPLAVWIAFRFGPFEAAIATCALSTIAIWGAVQGYGAIAGLPVNAALLVLQSFMAVMSGVGLTVGITVAGRRRAERRLRQRHAATESRLAEAQEIAHVGSWEWNAAEAAEWWSAEMYRICGVEPSSFRPSYESFLGLLPDDDRARFTSAVSQAVAAQRTLEIEHRIVRPDGSVRFVSSIGRVVVDEHRRATRITGATQDITERKAAEETVLRSERRLRTIFDAEPACVKLVSGDGTLLDMNRAGLAIIGARDRSDVIGRPAVELVHPDDRAQYQRMHEAAYAGSPSRLEFRVVGLTGDERWVDAHAVPFDVIVEGREARAVISVTSDVTERKRLEEQLRHSQKMEAVGRLAGGVAHDFNNLLTVIQGFSALMLMRVQDRPDLAGELSEIHKAAERAAQLTRQLLAFSRRQLLMPRVLDLNQIVAGMEKMLRRVVSEAIDVQIVSAPQLQPVKADPGQMEQLIMNLVVNASDAMPQGGRLTISTANVTLDAEFVRRHQGSAAGHYAALTVEDTGTGMAADVLARAFEPFFTTKELGKGTGLGLSTVYGLVKQSGGYITIDSIPGSGTKVTSYLPVVSAAADVAPSRTQTAPAAGGTETILLVEDEAGVRELVRTILESHGYKVLPAQDGDEALAIEAGYQGEIHLLLSDVIMPGLSGPALTERILERRPNVAVLFVSGHAGEKAVELGIDRERAGFLQKPFTPRLLAQAVRERLDAATAHPLP
jgi:PAS domain S-box-containing protein